MDIHPIAYMESDFPEKFGIPRQSGLVDTPGRIVFTPEYRNPDALRAIEGFSHLWLIWGFSKHTARVFSPTVRPPRLGGNRRVGVFATRSPFRPNPLGLSCVRLRGVQKSDEGSSLLVSGGDLADGTPIYDIKPYLAYTDSHPDAICGFADAVSGESVPVVFPPQVCAHLSSQQRDILRALLAHDPRPHYQNDPDRTYFLSYGNLTVTFRVAKNVLHVLCVEPSQGGCACRITEKNKDSE